MRHFIRVGTIVFRTKFIFRESNAIFLEIIIFDPWVYIMDHSDLIVTNFMENYIGREIVKES